MNGRMTNKEWLDYLAHNAPDELAAWFDAERITNQAEMLHMPESPTSGDALQNGHVLESTDNDALDGDTAPENADSRERLEADAKRYIEHAADYAYEDTLWADETFTLYDAIIELLDRQAAITERETTKRHELFCETCEAESDKQIAELTAERDELQAAFDAICANLAIITPGKPSAIAELAITTIKTLIDECNTANRQCKVYRLKFGKCLDYADAIHALMDEGMA